MATKIERDSNGHEWKNIGWNAYTCLRCGMDDYSAEGTGRCRGRRSFACGTQSNANTHGTCTRLFDTRREADAHYSAEHMTQEQRDDYAAYVKRHAARMQREG